MALSSSTSCRLFRKHLPADCVGRGGLGTQPDLHRETGTPKASQVMVSTTFPPPLFGCVWGRQEMVTEDPPSQRLGESGNRAFFARSPSSVEKSGLGVFHRC